VLFERPCGLEDGGTMAPAVEDGRFDKQFPESFSAPQEFQPES